jgi:hypothetical protein
MIRCETYTAPGHWACAAMYDDYSGMTDADETACRAWLESLPGPVVTVDFDGPDAPGFTAWHDAREFQPLACDAAAYTVHIRED